MNVEETKKAIEVMQAFVDGKAIETRGAESKLWTIATDPFWNFDHFRYRIKPEPREWYQLQCDYPRNEMELFAKKYISRESAESRIREYERDGFKCMRVIKVREVLE